MRTYALDVALIDGSVVEAPTSATDLDIDDLTRAYVNKLGQGSALYHVDGDEATIVPAHAIVSIRIRANDDDDQDDDQDDDATDDGASDPAPDAPAPVDAPPFVPAAPYPADVPADDAYASPR